MIANEYKNKLLTQYKYRIELHAHTFPASPCSQISPEKLVEIYSNLGFDAVTITNHFIYNLGNLEREKYVDAFLYDFEETKIYGEKLGIKVYLGAEVRFTENNNDYLIFGLNKDMLLEIYDLLPYGIENFRKRFVMPHSVLFKHTLIGIIFKLLIQFL